MPPRPSGVASRTQHRPGFELGKAIESTYVCFHLTDQHKAFDVFQLAHPDLQMEFISRQIEKYKDRADYTRRALRDHKSQVLRAESKR